MTLLRTPEFKVGALVLIVSVVIGWFSMTISEDPGFFGSARVVYFEMEDATGLIVGSPISLAGIRVGVIRAIDLNGEMARIEASVQPDIQITTSARIEVRAAGLLGDKNVHLIPGDPSDPLIGDGGTIAEVSDSASMDKVMGQVGKIADSLSAVAENIRLATEGHRENSLGRIISNLETLSGDLAYLSSEHRDEISEIVHEVKGITSGLNHFINDSSEDGFQAAWGQMVASLQNVESTLNNFEEISSKINRGEGTIGRLINDETTIEEINTAVSGINEFIGAGQRLQTGLEFNSNFMSAQDAFKTTVGVKIQPGLDRYYLVQVVDHPEGALEDRQIITSVDGGPESTVERREFFRNKVKFTALFAKNFHNLTVKGGMIESAGGFGLDYHMLRRRLMLVTEAYNLSDFRGRAFLRYNVFNGIYMQAGADDLFNDEFTSTNAFFGLGLTLDNDDIKTLLSRISF